MKKRPFLLATLLITASACRKNYTCHCSQGIGGASYAKGEVHTGPKKKADTVCLSEASAGESCYPVFHN